MTGGVGHQGTDSGASRRGRLLFVVAAVLLIGGGAAVTVGLLNQESAPQVTASSTETSAVSASVSSSSGSSSASARVSTSAPASPSSAVGSTGDSQPANSLPAKSRPAGSQPAASSEPVDAAAPQGTEPSKAAAPAPASPTDPPTVAAAAPVAVRIPAIGVQSDLITLGLNPDGSLEVPQPGPDYDKAGWFDGSPAPGEVGPSVIEGHIDSAANGPSVFFELGAVDPGDQIEVDRADGSTVRFVVDRVSTYPKDEFPTLEVYGNTAGPELRLITCGGDFDSAKGSYRDNTVVFAHLGS